MKLTTTTLREMNAAGTAPWDDRIIVIIPKVIPVNYEIHPMGCLCGRCDNSAGIAYKSCGVK